jgi:hypothetical protein
LTEVLVAQVCQNEKEGDIAAKKKELELADEEDFGNDCVGKAGISPTFLLILLFHNWIFCRYSLCSVPNTVQKIRIINSQK